MYAAPITPSWTADPRVQRILATFAKHPPYMVEIAPSARWDARTTTHAGYRVECLRRYHNAVGEAVLASCDAIDNYQAFGAFCDQPTVEQAVDAALVLA